MPPQDMPLRIDDYPQPTLAEAVDQVAGARETSRSFGPRCGFLRQLKRCQSDARNNLDQCQRRADAMRIGWFK
jgi:hypothetical protein